MSGNPVLAYNASREIGHVQGTLIDYDVGSVAAFWVNPGAAPYQPQVLPWSGVKTVEPDRVVAWSSTMLANVRELFSIRKLLDRKAIRPGMRFKTSDHQDLGEMVDFYFDEKNGLLEGYELATSSFAETADEYAFLPAVHIISISEDRVLVPANTVKAMQEKPGGLPALLEELNEQFHADGPATQDELVQYLLPLVKRLRVRRAVQLKNGVFLAAHGQIITAVLIQRAQAIQVERQLIEATGIDLDTFQHPV